MQVPVPDGVGWTAVATVSQRALESESADPLYVDTVALAIMRALPGDIRAELDAHNEAERTGEMTYLRGYVSIRTHYFDHALSDAAEEGIAQFVVLGAGLDGRGYRIEWPLGTRIFEVDESAVLDYKRRVTEQAGIVPTARLISVAADLQGDWIAALRKAGFDPAAPTAWLAEGLLNYLPTEGADRLLADVALLSAPGSRFIGSYLDPAAERALAEVAEGSQDPSARRTTALRERGPGKEPMRWLAERGYVPDVITVASHAQRLRRTTPPALDPGSGGGTCWLFTSLRPSRRAA